MRKMTKMCIFRFSYVGMAAKIVSGFHTAMEQEFARLYEEGWDVVDKQVKISDDCQSFMAIVWVQQQEKIPTLDIKL
jgi:hypothetical protein